MLNFDSIYEVAKVYKWAEWTDRIPYLKFPGEYQVKAIPPFGGAIIRYFVKHTDIPDSKVSIYLDCYDMLGYMGEPYWEIFPVDNGDCQRYLMNDINGLMRGIQLAFKKQGGAK